MPAPPSGDLNKNLYTGYYISTDETIPEMKDHVDFIFDHGWDSSENIIKRAKMHDKPIVLTITKECFGSFESNTLTPNIRDNLKSLFNDLRQASILSRVIALYPIDEPDGRHVSHETMSQCCQIVREVASLYPELVNTKLAVIYSTHMTWPGLEYFDIVGMDKYGDSSGVLISKEFKDLLQKKKPTQKLMLVPGGADPWKQNPEAFLRYALMNKDVFAIVSFLWNDRDEQDKTNNTIHYLGIRSNTMKNDYISLHNTVKAIRNS